LLDELRCNVFEEEMLRRGLAANRLTESYKKSFNRTIRDHDQIHVFRLQDPKRLPSGIVTRAAAFRIEDLGVLNRLLASRTAGSLVSIRQHETDRSIWTVKCVMIHRLEDTNEHSVIYIPTSTCINIAGLTKPSSDAILAIARKATWRIFRYSLGWHDPLPVDIPDKRTISPIDPISKYSRRHVIEYYD
jgi:hypothetical protein